MMNIEKALAHGLARYLKAPALSSFIIEH